MAAKILDFKFNEEESRFWASSSLNMWASAAVTGLDHLREITAQVGFPGSVDGASRLTTYLT